MNHINELRSSIKPSSFGLQLHEQNEENPHDHDEKLDQ